MPNSNSSKKYSITESVAEIVPTTTDDGKTWALMFNGVDLCTADDNHIAATLTGTEDLWIVVKNTKDWTFTPKSTWAYDDSGPAQTKMHTWAGFPEGDSPTYRYMCVGNSVSRINTTQDLSFKVHATPTEKNKKGTAGDADPVFKIIIQRPANPPSP